jgi:cytochrome c-type biogenesis protein CcmH/NrfG
VKSGAKRARSAAHNTREHLVDDVLPSVSSALGSALAAIEIAKSQKIRDAVKRATKAGTAAGTKVGLVEKKSGPGRYILAGVALVAVLGVAYAAWQTLREDEGLWIDDEPELAGDV